MTDDRMATSSAPGPEDPEDTAGAGIDTTVPHSAAPASRIVYVDNDPLVLAHARALLTSTPEGVTDYIDADMRDPGAVLARRGKGWTSASPSG